MRTLGALVRACHPEPTLLVTLVATALAAVGALQKKGSVEVYTLSSAMITDDIANGRSPSRTVEEIVAEAQSQVEEAAVPVV